MTRGLLAACLVPSVLALGGCGGVEFQGKIFDYAGLSGERKQEDTQMSERAPLVIPPNTNYLPPPGSGNAASQPNWPTDPEIARQQLVEKQAEAEKQKAASTEPLNPYAGKETLLDKIFGGNKTKEAAVSDIPSPDPADPTPPVNRSATKKRAPEPYKPPGTVPENNDPFHPSAGTYQGS
ncbi:hypothetical protein V6C03_07015 [Methyloligella sp. 2.7D]|uniref:hypothetical protein n=1 Tax=unclassified Methyloligella TaxID=2625955 RepID=UPI00157D428F|nr:hypothetical protein [Methyloligella sp. GL2]QKP78355.1 hypothetical protein HT051_13430 [Methyloligella sp. GL2]